MHTTRAVLTSSFLALVGSAGLFVNHGSPPSTNSDSHKMGNPRNMSNSVSTLLTRNLNEVFGENDPARRRKAIDEIFAEDAVFYDPMGGVFRGRDEIEGIAGNLGRCTLTFCISQSASRKKWEMPDVFDGRKAAMVSHQRSPVRILSLLEMAGLPRFISFSTSYPDQYSTDADEF